MITVRRMLHPWIATAAVAVTVVACDSTTLPTDSAISSADVAPRSATAPLASIPFPTTYSPTTRSLDQVKLCKDASSPAGVYNYTVSATDTQSGDQVASAASLAPGECTIIFNRVNHSAMGQFARVTIAETVPQGAAYRVKQINVHDVSGPRTVTATNTVTVQVNGMHGAVVDYVNEATTVTLPPPPPPIVNAPATVAANGQVLVCKSGPAGSTATFTSSISGIATGDAYTPTLTVAAGSCATMFQRNASHGAPATLVITEGAVPGTTLTGVTVNGSPATVTNRSVTVTQNFEPGKNVTFTNSPAVATAPATVAANGQVLVCKTGPAGSTATFTSSISGIATGDVYNPTVTVAAGTCATMFQRNASHGAPATLVITEGDVPGTTLTGVTVNGTPATLNGRSVTVTQNFEPGKNVTFTNSPGAPVF